MGPHLLLMEKAAAAALQAVKPAQLGR
jgi:hypothetical protein